MATADKATYSSTALRERDQKVQGQHEGKLNDLQRRHAYVERALNFKLFEASNRGQQLAELLGYTNLDEALMDIESAGLGPGLRDSVKHVQAAKARLDLEQVEVKLLEAKLGKAQHEREQLTGKYKALESAHRRLTNEHKDLISKYDSLADVRQRAGERYKADYKIWRDFYFWLVSDKPDEEHPGVSAKEKEKIGKWKPGVLQKRQDIIDGRINISFLSGYSEDKAKSNSKRAPPFGRIEMGYDKENDATPVPPLKKRRLNPTPSSPSPLPSNTLLNSITNLNASTASKPSTNFAPSAFKPLSIQPITSFKSSPKEIAHVDNPSLPQPSPKRIANSSDTEDDSQPVWLPKKQPQSAPASKPKDHATPPQASSSKLVSITHGGMSSRKPVDHSLLGQSTGKQSLPERMQVDRTEPVNTGRHSIHERETPSSATLTASARKGKEKQITDSPLTPLQDKSIRPDDYSVFKGRGRYGKSAKATEPTVNALYAIDPSNNGGLGYQFDEVVRTREARRKMHGGDCECCREYYEGVGPLPARLQAPLWRSPTSSPQKDRNANQLQNRHVADIESHKKAISRHRHTWARAPTPPGYWDIGFPDTQRVTEINEKAEEMHKRKKEEIVREAARGGRYRRRS